MSKLGLFYLAYIQLFFFVAQLQGLLFFPVKSDHFSQLIIALICQKHLESLYSQDIPHNFVSSVFEFFFFLPSFTDNRLYNPWWMEKPVDRTTCRKLPNPNPHHLGFVYSLTKLIIFCLQAK